MSMNSGKTQRIAAAVSKRPPCRELFLPSVQLFYYSEVEATASTLSPINPAAKEDPR